MKVVYDLRILTGTMHGIARYALGLLRALTAADPGLKVQALVRRPEDAQLLPAGSGVEAVVADLEPYGLKAQLKLPRLLRKLAPDLYHCPFYAPPARWDGPMLMTVHDLIHLRFPRDHGLRHRLFYQAVVGPAARRARCVFTVSQHSRKDVIEILGVPPRRVVVTPCGVDEPFRPMAAAARAQATYMGLPTRFILGVGNPRPHKNLPALVAAHRLLSSRPPAGVGFVPPLLLVGAKEGELAGVEPGRDLLMRPHMEDKDLALAYGAAEMVVVPSLYEGFGLPALEALACGAAVIASNRASLPEVVGEAGLLCAPDAASLAQAMGRLLAEPDLRARLAAKAIDQAAKFTWGNSAAIVLGVYGQAAEGRRT